MAEYINEHLRAQENTRRIMEIQKSLTGQNLPPLVAPGRRIIREGRLMKVGGGRGGLERVARMYVHTYVCVVSAYCEEQKG